MTSPDQALLLLAEFVEAGQVLAEAGSFDREDAIDALSAAEKKLDALDPAALRLFAQQSTVRSGHEDSTMRDEDVFPGEMTIEKVKHMHARGFWGDRGAVLLEFTLSLHAQFEKSNEQAYAYLRRIAAIDTAAHGYWDGPPEYDGRRDELLARVMELRDAWRAMYYTVQVTEHMKAERIKVNAILDGSGKAQP